MFYVCKNILILYEIYIFIIALLRKFCSNYYEIKKDNLTNV